MRLLTPPVLGIIAATVALEVVLVIGGSALARASGVRTSNTLSSFVLGALVATAILVLAGVGAVLSGGVNWITGSKAEQWTVEALGQLGPDWRILSNLPFKVESPPDTFIVDVDHVAVGPYGVLVVESKYSTDSIDLEVERLTKQLRNDAAQTARNVGRIKRLLPPTASGVLVTPVLVYWGWRPTLPEEPVRAIGRVKAVIGDDARRWRPLFAARTVDREIQDVIWESLLVHERAILPET
jgi:hypothetical protein